MTLTRTNRGFDLLEHVLYTYEPAEGRLLQTSSAICEKYDDAFDRPGSSYLWIGNSFHLDRDEVRELITYLQRWVDTGKLREETTNG